MTEVQSNILTLVAVSYGVFVCLFDEWLRARWYEAMSLLSEEDQAQLNLSPYEQ
jgi:hypothetical protein